MQNTVTTTTATILTIIGLVIGFFVGTLYDNSEVSEAVNETGSQVTQEARDMVNAQQSPQGDSRSPSGDGNAVAFTISTASLSESQRTMLAGAGITGDIAVTYNMLACAEGKIGASRLEEIKNGAAPSMSEGVQLMGCYE